MTQGNAGAGIELLRRAPRLGQLDLNDLERIAAVLKQRVAEPDEVLVEENSIGNESFLLVEGTAKVEIGGVPIAEVGPGEFVGEMALLSNEPRCATVTATTRVRMLVLDKDALGTLIDPITEALLGTLVDRLRRANDRGDQASADGGWRLGSRVEVRSRFDGTWVAGFELADCTGTGSDRRIQVRRLADQSLLPVVFEADEVRLA